MATDLEKLTVSLEANIRNYERNLQKALAQTNTQMRQIENRSRQTTRVVEGQFQLMASRVGTGLANSFKGFAGILAAGISTRAISQAAGQFVAIQNALRVTGLEGEKLNQVFNELYTIAQRNGTALGPLVTLYSRAQQAQKELGASTQDLFRFTEGVSLALRVAGTDSVQASGALLQLSQALGSARVQAEEFNSINEGARPILQAVANGIEEAGGSVSKLKQLVTEGKISNAGFFQGFLVGMGGLEKQAAKSQQTVGQAIERITNAFTKAVGEIDKVSGASANAATNLSSVATAISAIPGIVQAAATSLAGLSEILGRIGNSTAFEKIASLLSIDVSEAAKRASSDLLFRGDATKTIQNQIGEAQERLNDFERKALETTNIALRDRFTRAADRAKAELASLNAQIAKPEENTELRGRAGMLPGAPKGQSVKPISVKNFPVIGGDDKDKKKREDAYQREIRQIQEATAAMQLELGLIGQTEQARDKARAMLELENAARRAGITDIESLRPKMDEVADAYARVAEQARQAQADQQALNDLLQTFGDMATDTFIGLIDGTKSWNDALKDALSTLGRMFAQAAFTGGGPLGQLLGLGGKDGGVGGLFGSLFGKRAAGGPVTAGRPYIVGENGPELMVPERGGVVIPNASMKRSAGNGGRPEVNNYNDFRGVVASERAWTMQQLARLQDQMRAQPQVTSEVWRRQRPSLNTAGA